VNSLLLVLTPLRTQATQAADGGTWPLAQGATRWRVYDRSMYTAWRPAAVLALAALAAGGVADAAHAGTASGRPARFTASAGERNDLTVDAGSGRAVKFSDAEAPVGAGLWCVPFPLGQAQCDPGGAPPVTDGGGVSVDLGDGDDRATIRWVPGTDTRPGAISVTGGAGDDQMENLANGVIRFDGGDGNDRLVAGPAATAYLLGGAGADVMTSDAGCCAVASYADHDGAGVRVTLDGTASDGAAGEGDDVRTTGVIGSPGPDVITGDARANSLTGGGGADKLDGGGGDDSIDATVQDAPASDGPDTVTCGAGDDDVVADENDKVALDCERIRVGVSDGPELALEMGAARAGRSGLVALAYRVQSPNPDNALASRSTFQLVDGTGRAASSTAQFVLGGGVNVAAVRVKLSRATRRSLARSRSGALPLIAQRVSRDAGPGSAASGYEQLNVPVTIRRAGTR
jgi:Ca2+-binding RTX toxin-like protein